MPSRGIVASRVRVMLAAFADCYVVYGLVLGAGVHLNGHSPHLLRTGQAESSRVEPSRVESNRIESI